MKGKELIGVILGTLGVLFGCLLMKVDKIQKKMDRLEWVQDSPRHRKHLESRSSD